VSAPIEVLEVRPVEGHGNLRAFAKVKLGCLIIHGVRVIRQPNQRPWLSLPQQPARRKADGSGAGTNRDVLDRLREAVLDAWQQKRAEPPVGQAERGRQTAEAIDERAEAWSRRQRDAHIEELARRFDERGPDSVDDL
jgi:DNA-binding cell septation regulator SpoVG